MRLHLISICINRCALTYVVVFICFAKAPVDDVMRGPGDRWLESTADFVFALRAGLKLRDSVLDAEFDPLVIAGLEVQAVVIGRCAPVAAVEGLLRPEEDRGGDRRFAMHRQFRHEGNTHGAGHYAEKGASQVRLVSMAKKRITVERVHGIESALIQLRPYACLEHDACLSHAPTFALCLLALHGREGFE